MRTFIVRPRTVLFRKCLFQVHVWLGVMTGLYVLLVSVTGAALVFRIDMQKAIFPHLLRTQSAGDAARVLWKLP